MLRTSINVLKQLSITDTKCGNSAFALEFVRWRRKPRWLPMAKSKQNRVIERKRQPEDEKEELKRLHNIYKTQLRSVRQYLRIEAKRLEETTTAEHIVLTPEQEEAEFQRCMQENDDWNKKIAEERRIRLEKERQERIALIKERLKLAKIREEERLEHIEAAVRREKELSKTFITRETLDEAIERALANPVDYNFSIDLRGNMYHGRTTVPDGTGPPAVTSTGEGDKEKLEATN